VLACATLAWAAGILLTGAVPSFQTPSTGLRLLALDSDDPWLENRLGQAYKGINPSESLRHLWRAAGLSPASRLYWSDLASACEEMGDLACADRARQRLLELCPMVPYFHWKAAERDLRMQRPGEAVEESRRVLDLDPSYAPGVWASLGAVQTPDVIFQEMFTGHADPKLEIGYIDFLSESAEDEAAYRIWQNVMTSAASFPFSSARPYLERLIDRGRMEEAAGVWQDLIRLSVVSKTQEDQDENAVFNGDFEQFPLNAGFDWRWTDRLTYLALDFAAPGAYLSDHCLRIDFTVSRNEEYEPVYQIVPVLPNHSYRLEAYTRSEDITSDTGPSLRVSDTKQPSFRDAVTETTVGTTTWHPVQAYFLTGKATRAVKLSVWRPLGRVFPTEISGSFWLDKVTLECVDPEGSRAIPAGVRVKE